MAGLAAIEIAQKVSKVWRSLQSEWRFSTNNKSKNGKRPRRKEKIIIPCSTNNNSEASTSTALEEKSTGQSVFSWLHLYSIAVKWRQISEPCDPVVWVNKLRYLNISYIHVYLIITLNIFTTYTDFIFFLNKVRSLILDLGPTRLLFSGKLK